MFERQSKVYSRLLLGADVLASLAVLYCSYYARYYLVLLAPLEVSRFFNPELLPLSRYFLYYLLLAPLWICLLVLTQRYSEVLRLPLTHQTLRVLQFVLAGGFLAGFFVFSFKLEVSRPVFFSFLILTVPALTLNRFLFHWVLRSRNINEHNQIKILIAGTDGKARALGERLEGYRIWGYRVVGYLRTAEAAERDEDQKADVLGPVTRLPELVREGLVADEIIFLARPGDVEKFEETVRLCEELGIRTRLAAGFFPTSISRVSLEFLDNIPLITFSTAPDPTVGVVAKRVVDFLVSVTLLILLSPLMLLTAFLIKFTSPGPVFYRQVRCGLFGRRFTLVKFRTMVQDAEDRLWDIRHLNEMDGPVFKMRHDPRVTPLGKVLRKFSIDELPQLWNVIKGEMSVVGPRAPLPEEVEHYAFQQRRRLSVKPGITCLWQVSGRNNIDFDRWMEMDLEYIDNWSFWLDLRIMLRTIPAVFTGRGAR